MDLATLAFEIGFEGALGAAALLLVLTFLSFLRMNREVRRARMYIMADRVIRFLGAFTVGFAVIATVFLFSILSIPPPALVSAAAIVLFIGAVLYGSAELFLIVRPRKAAASSRRGWTPAAHGRAETKAIPQESAEGESDAAR